MLNKLATSLYGKIHNYQYSVFNIGMIISLLTYAHSLNYAIFVVDPVFICLNPENSLIEEQEFICGANIACSGRYKYRIDENSIQSFAMEYGFYCENRVHADLVGTFAFMGKTLGLLYYALAIDTSKPLAGPLLKAGIIQAVAFIFGGLSPLPVFYYVAILVAYFYHGGVMTLSFGCCVEIIGNNEKMRNTILEIMYSFCGLSCIYLSILCLGISDNWRMINVMYLGIPLLWVCLVYRNLEDEYYEFRDETKGLLDSIGRDAHVKGYISNMFFYKSLRGNTIIMMFLDLLLNMIYFGAHIAVDSLDGSIYANLSLLAVVEIIGNVITVHIVEKFNRNSSMITLFALGALIYSGFFFIEMDSLEETSFWIPLISSGLALIGKMLNVMAFSISHTQMSELYPDNYRPIIYSFVGVITGLFIAILPEIITHVKMLGINPYVLFAFANFISMFLNMMLPETKGFKLMKIAVEDIDKYAKNLNDVELKEYKVNDK